MKKLKPKPEINSGDLVTVEGYHEHGKIISIEPLGDLYKVDLFFPESKQSHTVIYPLTEIRRISTPLEMVKSFKFDPSYKFNLFTDATRFSLAHLYDPFFSLSVTRIDVLPHQIEAVYKVVGSYDQKFLIADDAGLGKTIMAGMIIKELQARGRASRILVVVPAALQYQWKREMLENFEEQFMMYNSEFVRNLASSLPPSANPWDKYDKIITSIDFAKREEIMAQLNRTKWDLVIFDEAHKLSAFKWGEDVKKTDRYRLAELLKDKTDGMLFLTATPHKGDSFAFYALLSLLDPYLFPDEFSIDKKKLGRIMIRRLKEDVTNFDGGQLFPPREVKTLPVEFSPEEHQLYEAVTDYVSKYYNIAKQTGNRNVGFAMVILQKRMVSSIAAIKQSLKNRKDKLKRLLELGEKAEELTAEEASMLETYEEEPEVLTDEERGRLEKKLEAITASKTTPELRLEIEKLEELIRKAEFVKKDSKIEVIVKFVESILEKDPKEKILIFTEYTDTLGELEKVFQKYRPAIIHGGIDSLGRENQENYFKQPGTKLMIATDAAGEGLNLQFSHIMVNYELPWNPNRIEQRMGRLHRYLQTRTVDIRNLLILNTREGEIFQILMEKLERIKEEMGERVFDILGTLLSDIDFEREIMDILTEKDKEKIRLVSKNIEEIIEQGKKVAIEKIEKESLIRGKLNLAPLRTMLKSSREWSIDEKDLERFIKVFFDNHNGKLGKTKKGVYSLLPPKKFVDGEQVKSRYPAATFSRETARELGKHQVDYVALGHPLIDRMIETCKSPMGGGRASVKLDPSNRCGMIFNYLTKTMDGTGRTISERMYSLFADLDNGEINEVDPKMVWEFEDSDGTIEGEVAKHVHQAVDSIDYLREKVEKLVLERVKEFVDKTAEERMHEIKIKKTDAETFLNRRIEESKATLREYKARMGRGEDMKIAIISEESRLKEYEDKLKDVRRKLELESKIIPGAPELLSLAIIVPKGIIRKVRADEEARREVEQEGMHFVMGYERRNGRIPEDVSKEFRGYDVKSVGKEETRYIEVKAFAESDAVEMTENEWIMANKLGNEYWLYIVEHALDLKKRRLCLIQNPAKKFPAPEILPAQIKVRIKDWQKSVDVIEQKS